MKRLGGIILLCMLWDLATAPMGGAAINTAPKLRILASTFPITLFTRNITHGVDGVVVESMLPPSMGCPHDYVLTPADMEKIGRANVFIANGLGLEEFLGEPLRRANPKIRVIDSSAGIEDILLVGQGVREQQQGGGPKEAERSDQTGEGNSMQADKTHSAEETLSHDEHAGPNPHLFASPHMAAQMVRTIALALAKIDPAHAEAYNRNASAYAATLEQLAAQFAAAGNVLSNRKIITQHSVFDYLARDMGLEIVAVVEENPGQEPSAADMLELVRLIKKQKVGAVFTEPQYSPRPGQTLAKETGIPAESLDPVASGPEDAPLNYYQRIMTENLETIERTLGHEGS